jgi:hypothetical protein
MKAQTDSKAESSAQPNGPSAAFGLPRQAGTDSHDHLIDPEHLMHIAMVREQKESRVATDGREVSREKRKGEKGLRTRLWEMQ